MTAQDLSAFISYSREDSEFALRLAGDLRAAGAAVWFDQADILTGEHWDTAIERALVRCPRMLLILSPASVASVNVNDEVSFALEKGKIVLPVLYRDCEIPFRIRRLQYTDFRTDYTRALKGLLNALLSIPSSTNPAASWHPPPSPLDTPVRVPEASAHPPESNLPFAASPPAATAKPFIQRRTVHIGVAAFTVAIILIGIFSINSFSRRQAAKAAKLVPSPSASNFPPPPVVTTAHEASPIPADSNSSPEVKSKQPMAGAKESPASNTPDSPTPPSEMGAHKRASIASSNTSAPVAAPKPVSAGGSPGARTQEEIAAIGVKADELWRVNRFQEALPGLEQACDAGIVRSCTFLGVMYEYGKGVVKDQDHAIALYTKSCNAGYGLGCFSLGSTYAYGDSEVRDYPKAITALQKGCDGSNGSSCFTLGELFREGTKVIQDNPRAVANYRRGCDIEDMPSCYHLGLMYQNGAGVTENLKTAADLYRKSCDATIVPACFRLGQFYEQGLGTPVDRAQAASFYRRACGFGLSEACESLKNLTQ